MRIYRVPPRADAETIFIGLAFDVDETISFSEVANEVGRAVRRAKLDRWEDAETA